VTHEELRELLPAAALEVVEDTERHELERHVASCTSCSAEVAALRETVGWMGAAVAPVDPPPGIRAGIIAIPYEVRPVEQRTRFRTTVTSLTGFATAAVLAGVLMYASGLSTRLQSIENELAAERDLASFLASADTATIVLAGTDEAPKARLKLAYDRHTGRAILFGYDLPPPPDGKTYQVWFIAGGKPVPGRIFSPDATGRGIWNDQVPPDGREASIFAVTLEPAGGVAAPTGPMVMKSVSVS
jgi:anti-sigma-K factor RskA